MKRHFEWLTQPDQTLKDRSRFWTWYMRGLHGDMDTRYEGDRRVTSRTAPTGRHITSSSDPSGFGFKPLASNTYGYHPKGVSVSRRPDAGLAAQHALALDNAGHQQPSAVDNKRPNWSTPLKSLDDIMLLNEPRSSSVPPRRSLLPTGSGLRQLPIDPALDDLLKPRPYWPRRGWFNRVWRPSLFWDDDALLMKPGSWINDPWWHKYPELRPLDLATTSCRPPTALRTSYLSPVKRTYVWGYRHPLRPFGYHSWESRY